MAAAGGRPAGRGRLHPKAAAPVRRGDHRPAGGISPAESGDTTGQARRAAPRLRQRSGEQPCPSPARDRAGEIRGQRHHLSPEPYPLGGGALRPCGAVRQRGGPSAPLWHVLRRRGADHPERPVPPVQPADAAGQPHPSAEGHLPRGAGAGPAVVARPRPHPRPDHHGAVSHRECRQL